MGNGFIKPIIGMAVVAGVVVVGFSFFENHLPWTKQRASIEIEKFDKSQKEKISTADLANEALKEVYAKKQELMQKRINLSQSVGTVNSLKEKLAKDQEKFDRNKAIIKIGHALLNDPQYGNMIPYNGLKYPRKDIQGDIVSRIRDNELLEMKISASQMEIAKFDNHTVTIQNSYASAQKQLDEEIEEILRKRDMAVIYEQIKEIRNTLADLKASDLNFDVDSDNFRNKKAFEGRVDGLAIEVESGDKSFPSSTKGEIQWDLGAMDDSTKIDDYVRKNFPETQSQASPAPTGNVPQSFSHQIENTQQG